MGEITYPFPNFNSTTVEVWEWMNNLIPYFLILALIGNHMSSKVWDEITYPFPNFNSTTVEVWEWINNFIPHFIMDVILYPCLDLKFLPLWVHKIPYSDTKCIDILKFHSCYECVYPIRVVAQIVMSPHSHAAKHLYEGHCGSQIGGPSRAPAESTAIIPTTWWCHTAHLRDRIPYDQLTELTSNWYQFDRIYDTVSGRI